ncbi:MAG: nuclear transport factor 2 family protein [Armatimonadetes bacterium]|nr:nuclear transport factor 2 family protein [Armatimonadota bacterium]
MMFSRWFPFSLALFLMIPPVSAQSSSAAVRSALQAQYNRYTAALRNKDIKTVVSLLTMDFKQVLPNGDTEDRIDVKRSMQERMKSMKQIQSLTVTLGPVAMKGPDKAVVTATEKFVGRLGTPGGGTWSIVQTSISEDTWVRTSGVWKLKQVRPISDKYTSDTSGVRPALEAAYRDYRRAVMNKDLKKVMSFATKDFTIEFPDGRKQYRDESMDGFARTMMYTKSFQNWDAQIIKLLIGGTGKATATVKETVSTTIVDRKGREYKQVVRDTTEDTWVRTDFGWKIEYSKILVSEVSIDGKVVARTGKKTN